MSKILVIDDHFPNARLAEKLLVKAGHDVVIAYDGETGLEMFMSEKPDLLLVDMGLPDMDGQTVVGLLRHSYKVMDTPIIAYTAWPEEVAQEMVESYGCNGAILKPIDIHTFAQEINGYILLAQASV